MALQLDHLDLLDGPVEAASGTPLSLPIDSIDEDPAQPRQEFDDESLGELAETIRQRGVRQPISVRRHPADPDRWMVNFGARRLRASKLAGRTQIPAFVDQAADDYDQVLENEQREGLTALELALFVKRRLKAGDDRQEIARRLGKSKAYITMVCAMVDPPDWLVEAYRSGRCRGIAELYELRRLHESRPAAAEELLARHEPISRAEVRSMKASAEADVKTVGHVALPGSAVSEAATLQRRAELLCVELASTLERLKASSPERASVLRDRLVSLANSCGAAPV